MKRRIALSMISLLSLILVTETASAVLQCPTAPGSTSIIEGGNRFFSVPGAAPGGTFEICVQASSSLVTLSHLAAECLVDPTVFGVANSMGEINFSAQCHPGSATATYPVFVNQSGDQCSIPVTCIDPTIFQNKVPPLPSMSPSMLSVLVLLLSSVAFAGVRLRSTRRS